MATFREQLKQFFAKTFKGFYIEVTKPKKFLLDCGVPDLPIVITPANLTKKIEKHNLTKDDLQSLNTLLNSPLIVYHSQNQGKYYSAFSVITERKNNEGYLCVVIYINEKINKIEINNIASIHYRNINSLIKWCEENYLIDSNIEKCKKVFSGSCHNDSKFEYLLSLLDIAKLKQKNQNTKGLGKNILGYLGFEGLGSIRTEKPPRKTGIGYKVFFKKNGKLYPPMVANPGGEDTPIGVWLDADAAPISGKSKTGRPQVKAGGKGTQGGSGQLAYRPGWHLGKIPYAIQFNRADKAGKKTLFPKDFVWAICEYAADINYQKEAEAEGMTKNGKFNHAYAGLKYVPKNGYYIYRTNPNPKTDPWIITGAMKVIRVLTDAEVDKLVRKAGRKPQQRELGCFSAGSNNLGGFTIGFKPNN